MALPEKIQKERDELVEKLIADIQKGKPFFWDSGHYSNRPNNAVTQKPYKGINVLPILYTAIKNGYKDSRWVTYKQAIDKGGHVKKGEKGVNVEFWSYKKDVMEKDPKTGKWKPVMVKDEKTGRMKKKQIPLKCPLVKTYTIFNVQQTEGMNIPPYEHKITIDDKDKNVYMENMIKNSEAPISYDQQDSNYYNSRVDEIHVMPREEFKTMDNFYATCAHEIAHSTGAEKRLNRDSLVQNDGFGGPIYAKEELRAELSSMFLQMEYGISFDEKHYKNHAAYLQSWVKALKDDPNELYKAASDAEKAVEYIKSKMLEKGIEKVIAVPDIEKKSKKTMPNNEVELSPKEKLQKKLSARQQDTKLAMEM